MRLGVRAWDTVVITLLVLLVVGTTTAVHLSRLWRVVVEEASREAELISRQIYAQAGQAVSRGGLGDDSSRLLQDDRDLRSLVEASVGYSPHLLYAMITDSDGRILLHTEPDKEGSEAPARPALEELLRLDPARRLAALYPRGTVYETALPLKLNNQPFGTIRLGLSTTLLKGELDAALKQSLVLAGVALPVAWIIAMLLTRLMLHPLRALSSQVDRIRRGEFEAGAGAPGGDEFQELSSQLERLGRELHADRLATLSEKAQLQHVVDQLEDGVIVLNRRREVVFFNRMAEAVIGQPLDRVVGRPLGELLDAGHPVVQMVEQVFDDRSAFRNATLSVPHGDRAKECLVSAFFVSDAGDTNGVVLVKDLESVKTVQSLVSYSAKLAALARLTSGVAHEMKNPLNAMMIHLELLHERLERPSEQVEQSVQIIGSEIRRLDRVVQGFLRFMRPQEITFARLDLNELLQNQVALLEAEWRAQGVRVALALDPELPPIGADSELLRQAWLNILQNAGQAMPAGGTVTVRSECDGRDWVRVSVADEGVGVPAEDLDRIFKLYYTTKPEGSGIGLSVVYRIVQMHDGTIDVQSEVGRGTTMTVRLPVR